MIIRQDWNSYLCKVNDEPASVFLNLGLHEHAPIGSKTWLLWVWVYFNSPRNDGLSSSDEAPLLYKIEDQLVPAVSDRCGAVLAGRITTCGRREFYLYGEQTIGSKQAVADVMSLFPGYSFDCDSQPDPEWKQYFGVLYPSDRERQLMENRNVLDVLEKHGDRHEIVREVNHLIYFSDTDSRELFARSVVALGYSSKSLDVREDGSYPVELTRFQPVTQNAIDHAVVELFDLALKFEGNYDGWGCEAQN
jgi:uncharacterized protein (TIGR01619 family)